jgi:hypothetical protein
MIRVLVMANDSLLVDAVGSILVVEIGPDVLQLAYQLPRHIYNTVRDPLSVLIVIDEGESQSDSIKLPESFREEGPLLMIKASLKAMNINIFKGYQLTKPLMEQVMELVRDFINTDLKKQEEDMKLRILVPSPVKT